MTEGRCGAAAGGRSSGWTGCRVKTLPRCHTLLPGVSGEVQDPPDAPGQMLVTQPGPVMVSLLLQPSENTVHRLRSRNPPSSTAQAEGKAEWVVCFFAVSFLRLSFPEG